MSSSSNISPATKPSTSTLNETKIIKLAFLSSCPEEDDGLHYEISDEELFFVFTVPYYLGARYSVIKWDNKPCGIRLTPFAQDCIMDRSEFFKNPWCPDVGGFGGEIKCPAGMLSEFRTYLEGIFEDSSNWKNRDGSEFTGKVIRVKAVA